MNKGYETIREKRPVLIPFWNLFKIGGGLLCLHCSMADHGRKRHIVALNLDDCYLYDGGDVYLPFKPLQTRSKSGVLRLLKSFGIQKITKVFLCLEKGDYKSKIEKEKCKKLILNSVYGNIDQKKYENIRTYKLSQYQKLVKQRRANHGLN